jgi:general secretion pathway protein G
MKKYFSQLGVTLIELLICLSILGVLASITVPFAKIAIQRNKESELRHALREIRNGIDAFKRASDDGRISTTNGKSGYPPNLEILVDGIEDQRDPQHKKIYFLRKIPHDPFSIDGNIVNSNLWGLRSYSSDANAPEEGDDVYDVFSKSSEIGLNNVELKKW